MTSRRLALEQLEIKTPCTADWNAMTGDAAARFCQHCQKHVHDLSAMPRDQAERLVCQNAGELCIRMSLAPDGQVITLDYRPQKKKGWGWKAWTVVALGGALITGAIEAVFLGKRMQAAAPAGFQSTVTPVLMGEIAPPPPPKMGKPAVQQVVMGGCPAPPRQ